LDDAYRICERNIEKRIKGGVKNCRLQDRLYQSGVSREDGSSGFNVWLSPGVDGPEKRVKVAMSDLIAPKLECEICLKLKNGLKGKG